MGGKQDRYRIIAVLAFVLPLFALAGVAEAKQPPPGVPWTGPVPKAQCGPNDRPETGLQGQTSVAERETGLAELGFNCNLELVGQFQGEGASYGFDWFDGCGYYGTANTPEQQHPGVVVVDASDPRNPQASGYLDSRAMLEPWESLKVHRKRKLLGANKGPGGPEDRFFAFYDVSDCAHPVLLSDIEVPDHIGHAGAFAPDGQTYYGTWIQGRLTALDIADPTRPKVLLLSRQYPVHDLAFSADGTRAYLAQIGNSPSFPNPNGLVIVDVSDVQFRRPNPQVKTISTLFWNDGSTAQQALPVSYRGQPHLIFTDERGAFGSGVEAKQAACAQGLPPHGFARIIDISDERNPRVISKLMLEVSDPANCAEVLNDPDRYSYSSHYCNVDRTNEPRLLACSWRDGGLRVFDIRDPYRPREIAYYKPPARRMAFLPGSIYWRDTAGGDRTGDQTPSNVRFRRYKGETQLWFTSQDNGFQIVRFTNGVLNRKRKTRGKFDTLPAGADLGLRIRGVARITRTDDGTAVGAVLRGLRRGRIYAAHLHNAPCSAADPGGGHYKDDPAGPSAPPNELWLSSTDDPTAGIRANRRGVARGRGSADWVARPDAQSVVIHHIPPGGTTAGGPKIACADLD